MPDEQLPEKIEVAVPEMKPGKVEFMNEAGFKNPAPEKMKRVLAAMKYTFVGLITMVSGTDLFSGRQSKIACFVMGICVLICGAIELATGVKQSEETTTE